MSVTVVEPETVERRVLDLVSGLVAELRGAAPVSGVTLEALLDRDLGLGSLERVELLVRLERAFGVRLPDRVVAEAERPADLVEAVLEASLPAQERDRVARERLGAAPRGVPTSAQTLVEVLRWHVEHHADRVHIFLRDEEGQEHPISYGTLYERSMRVAASLRSRGVGRHEPVALMLRTEEAFFPAFFGTLLAGGVPVPIYPPFRADRIEEYARRQTGIVRNAEARLLVTFAEAERVAALLRAEAPRLADVVSVDRLLAPGPVPPFPDLTASDPALIQYTSGSTGDPKGVLLTHANLLANIRAIGEAVGVRPDDVVVSWLPLYHDMGLIGSWFGSLYFGLPLVLLSPLAFLARPARWLWAFHAHRGTISPAPNFAYELCVSKVAEEELTGLDLSSWRIALNGSEPVSPTTIDRFVQKYAPYGFKREAMLPVYGMAECSVGLTVPPVGRPPRIDRVLRRRFETEGIAEPAPPDDPTALSFVACGRPLPGHELRIVDAHGRAVGPRVVGRIEFRGPSAMQGYYRNPAATAAVLHDGWIITGDLGYVADGELFITGREKDVIILGGRNIYPQEVEEVVGELAGVRKGCVAAFGVADPTAGTERLIVVAETRERDPDARERLRAAVVDRVAAAIGVPPHTVVLAPPGAVLKTSSGKIRRRDTREAYLRGDLGRRRSLVGQWAWLLARNAKSALPRVGNRLARGAYTAYVAIVFVATVVPLDLTLHLLPTGPTARRLYRWWAKAMVALSGCRVRVTGAERLVDLGPAVLVANHASYIDSAVLAAVLPCDFFFVAKRRLVDYPIIGTVIRKAGYLTVERADVPNRLAGADRVVEALREGRTLLIFPEGTFVRAPGLLPFRLGAFRAAVEAGRPVVPIALKGTRRVLPDGTWLLRPGPIDVTVGPPLAPHGEGWAEMVRLRDLARAEIARHVGEPMLG